MCGGQLRLIRDVVCDSPLLGNLDTIVKNVAPERCSADRRDGTHKNVCRKVKGRNKRVDVIRGITTISK